MRNPESLIFNCSQALRDAMWLRDSANQLLSYLYVLRPSSNPNSLAALFRGVINAQSRYIKVTPYCHAYPPPPESGFSSPMNGAYHQNKVHMFGKPGYDQRKTFDCKWELDSLASFLQISSEYYNATRDLGPFKKYRWVETVEVILHAANAMRTATYTSDGHIAQSGYTMTGHTDRATETTSNNGLGNPVIWTGMVRSTFRPSDDATIFQFFIPGNMMFARQLEAAAGLMDIIGTKRCRNLAFEMRTMATEIRGGITKYGIVSHPQFGAMFAFEVDGYGGQVCRVVSYFAGYRALTAYQNLMDDANLPSLLSASMMGYVSSRDEVYQNTRLFALSKSNPYWAFGDAYNAIGGPHLGPTKGWPLASIVRILTSEDVSGEEASHELREILGSTDGLGLVHESISSWNSKDWSRQW
jgi:meiotically up-regulated gene 157 (Mug157) protein